MERLATYSLKHVLPYVKKPSKNRRRNYPTIYESFRVRMGTHGLRVFKKKGIECVTCGIRGVWFHLERHEGNPVPHLALYAVKPDGAEVRMTVDHIKPRSVGGRDTIENLQPMCSECNAQKGAMDNDLFVSMREGVRVS